MVTLQILWFHENFSMVLCLVVVANADRIALLATAPTVVTPAAYAIVPILNAAHRMQKRVGHLVQSPRLVQLQWSPSSSNRWCFALAWSTIADAALANEDE